MRSRRVLLIAAAAGAAVLLLRPWRAAPREDAAALGAKAPGFHLSDTAGRVVSLADYKGQVVLLNFWATWCEACEQEMPDLDKVYLRNRAKGFELLAASVDEEGRKAVLPYLARHSLSFPVLLSDPQTQRAYRVFGLPSNFLIDAEGRIARVYAGPVDAAAVENDILELLKPHNSQKS